MLTDQQETFNNQFFTDIMRKHENDTTLKIEDFKISSACEPGGNFTCEVNRISIEGRRRNPENDNFIVYRSSVIAKQVPKNELHAKLYCSEIAMDNEKNAYEIIIPELTKCTDDGNLPVAKCLHSAKGLLVLEDLKLKGYDNVNKADGGLSLTQCKTVVQALAKLHAASLVMRAVNPDKLGELSKLIKETMFIKGDCELLNSQKQYIRFALNTFKNLEQTPENKKAVEFLDQLNNKVDKIINDLFITPSTNPHFVISHGDAWVGNVMFDNDNGVKLIDLQLMRYNSIAADLCYLFYVNLQPSLVIEHYDSLLKEYLNALLKNTETKGVNLRNALTEEWLSTEMRKYAEYGIMRALWVMPMFFYKPEDVNLSNISPQLLKDTKLMAEKVGPEYEVRLKELVLNYVKKWNTDDVQ